MPLTPGETAYKPKYTGHPEHYLAAAPRGGPLALRCTEW